MTNIYGGGTLWCINNYRMDQGGLQTTDSNTNILKVGTGGSQPVDGTVNLLGGSVGIFPNGTTTFGTLQIKGTTEADEPILNLGSVTLNFNTSLATNSTACAKLIVGDSGGTGKVNFGYNGGTTTVAIKPQGSGNGGNKWQVIFFGSKTGDVSLSPPAPYKKNWQPNYLEIDNG